MKKVLEDFTLIGTSRAMGETYFYLPDWHLSLDIGRCPPTCLKAKYLFLSHLHRDHAGGLWYFIATNAVLRPQKPATIWVAKEYEEKLLRALDAWADIEQREYPTNFTFFEAPCTFPLSSEREIYIFPVDHTLPTFGCTIYERREKLKEEYRGKSFAEIASLKEQGVELCEVERQPLLSYLGDTTAKALDDYTHVFESKYLLLECTFLEEKHRPLAERTKHIHFQDICERKERFQNEQIFLTHFSYRYKEEDIRFFLQTSLPAELEGRVVPWLD